MAEDRRKDAESAVSCDGEETTESSGGEETTTRVLCGREEQQPVAMDAVERLQALQQMQEAVMDAEKEDFDRMVEAEAQGSQGIEDLHQTIAEEE